MGYTFITVPFLLSLLWSLTTSSPVNPKVIQEETVAVYVPYELDVPYDELFNVKLFNSKNPEILEKIVLRKENILNHLNNKANGHIVIRPVSNDEADLRSKDKLSASSLKNDYSFKDQLHNDNLVVLPLPTISEVLQNKDVSKPIAKTTDVRASRNSELDASEEFDNGRLATPLRIHKTSELYPEEDEILHRISKRQAARYPFYRPVARFSSISSSRRRFNVSPRRHAFVGYLSDRDRFPTVA